MISDSNGVTILGASGCIGKHIHNFLKENYICKTPMRSELKSICGNLGHIIYCLGITSDFKMRPLETVDAHICVLRHILDCCTFESFTYLSSTRVYMGGSCTDEATTLSINPMAVDDLYNITKIAGESLCLHPKFSNVKVIRLSNIVAHRSDENIFINQILHQAYSENQIQLQSSLTSEKDYIYIDDAVKIITEIAFSQHTGIFNVGSGINTTNESIINHITNNIKCQISVNKQAKQFQFPQINIGKVSSLFSFTPTPFDTYFPHYLQQYKEMHQ